MAARSYGHPGPWRAPRSRGPFLLQDGPLREPLLKSSRAFSTKHRLVLGAVIVSRPNNKGSHFCKSMCVISCSLSLGALEALIKQRKEKGGFLFLVARAGVGRGFPCTAASLSLACGTESGTGGRRLGEEGNECVSTQAHGCACSGWLC